MKKIFFVVFIMSAFVPVVSASATDEQIFFKNLKSCKPYYSSVTTEQGEVKTLTTAKIAGFEDKKCVVSFVVSSSSEKYEADAADIELCKFSKKELKKINRDNFKEYKENFCSGL